MSHTAKRIQPWKAGARRWAQRCNAPRISNSVVITVALAVNAVLLAGERPNILWLTSEDHGPQVGCYGDALAHTPHLDSVARRGLRFRHVWSNAPVCAPARTALITGIYPTSLGAEAMRSEVPLPTQVRLLPQYLRDAGYYCCNNSKEDYNVRPVGPVWHDSSNQAHWRKRAADQPFFAVFNSTQSHESQIRKRPHQAVLDPARVRIPAYHPDTPEVRRDWAQYYDQISAADEAWGRRLRELAVDELVDDTIIFCFADHGSGMPRNKRWPGNAGLQVPLVVYFPPKWQHLAPASYQAGGVSDQLVSFVDFAPTVLSVAGIRPPASMQGRAFAGPFQQKKSEFLYGFRGRMDERLDLARSVTDGRFVYIRNYHPHRAAGQHIRYQFETPTTRVWRQQFDDGLLTSIQASFWQAPRPIEELYDLEQDPDEVHNLAQKKEMETTLLKLRTAHVQWTIDMRDLGLLTEAEMHARCLERAPQEVFRVERDLAITRLSKVAQVAAAFDGGAIPQLMDWLTDQDAGVRYWAAVGLLIRGDAGHRAARKGLAKSLQDESLSVRVPAAESLVRHGSPEEREMGLQELLLLADPSRTNAYVATAALNAIDALGSAAHTITPQVLKLPTTDPHTTKRARDTVERLQTTLRETTAKSLSLSPPPK